MKKYKKVAHVLLNIFLIILISINIYQLYQKNYISKEYNRIKTVKSTNENETAMKKIESLLDSYDNYYYKDIESKEEFVDNMIRAFQITTEDKYSSYIDRESMVLEEREFSGEYQGIGITMNYPKEDVDYIIISEVQKGSPAYEAGVLPGTKLYKINGVQVATDEANNILKDIAAGKIIEVRLNTDKGEYTIIPTKLDFNTVSVEYDGAIAVIKISSFTDKTDEEFLKVFSEIENNKKIKGLIFDLRNNHGGDKDSVTTIVDRLAPKGLLYKEKYKTYSDDVNSDEQHTELPIAILGNGETASASELFTMTLQDTNNAVLIGEKTYGKSTILIYIPFDDGTGMMLSTGFYYPPSDRFIEGVGIEPDIPDSEYPYETAIKYLNDKISGETLVNK